MSACVSKLSSSVSLEAPTTDVNASQLSLVFTSHDGGNRVTAGGLFLCQKTVAGTAIVCS